MRDDHKYYYPKATLKVKEMSKKWVVFSTQGSKFKCVFWINVHVCVCLVAYLNVHAALPINLRFMAMVGEKIAFFSPVK